ncbi:MAG: hypothetical protein VKL59_08570 [Nostocaceae cyanobacterium]|nr:hypothetical protein [Nostocaceae cyanobacterium]
MNSNRKSLGTQGSARLIDDVLALKEFADAYGLDMLKRAIALAETDYNRSHPESTSAKADILQQVEDAGFELNPWLENFILDANVEIVRDAIAVVKENLRRGITVHNPEGMLVSAIRKEWKPNIPA